MKAIYEKLVTTRHADVLERKAIGGSLDRARIIEALEECLVKYTSLPIGFELNDGAVQYSGFVFFRGPKATYRIKEFQESSYLRYKMVSDVSFSDFTSAANYYIAHEFRLGIDGIPFRQG